MREPMRDHGVAAVRDRQLEPVERLRVVASFEDEPGDEGRLVRVGGTAHRVLEAPQLLVGHLVGRLVVQEGADARPCYVDGDRIELAAAGLVLAGHGDELLGQGHRQQRDRVLDRGAALGRVVMLGEDQPVDDVGLVGVLLAGVGLGDHPERLGVFLCPGDAGGREAAQQRAPFAVACERHDRRAQPLRLDLRGEILGGLPVGLGLLAQRDGGVDVVEPALRVERPERLLVGAPGSGRKEIVGRLEARILLLQTARLGEHTILLADRRVVAQRRHVDGRRTRGLASEQNEQRRRDQSAKHVGYLVCAAIAASMFKVTA